MFVKFQRNRIPFHPKKKKKKEQINELKYCYIAK